MRMRKGAVLLALTCATAIAAPAPWFKWRSQADGKEVCAQTMPGAWEKVRGPYMDAQCKKPGMPGERNLDPLPRAKAVRE